MSEPVREEPAPGDVPDAARLWKVLYAPRAVFEAIARRPSTLLVLLLLAAIAAAVAWVGTGKVDPQEFLREAEKSGRQLPPNLTPEKMLGFAQWSGTIGAFLGTPIVYGIAALLALTLLRLVGSDSDFRRVFSATLHGFLPFALAGIIGLGVILARDSVSLTELRGGGVLASSLGALADEDTNKYVRALLGSVDLFSIWSIALLGVGYATVGKVSRAKGFTVVGVIWALGILLKLALTSFAP